ncbi:uncharacterized protein LOC125277639 [Megalobrama amblycephala]|uniref:uncharacterized protein LOC125277639 n=1 Tax=Megalobrama amblycephala TaxID=75352 RepID=UPI0020145926|nr:uncharacterized protein LOC125277639 [Megalobrama amblycephala]
MYNISVTCAEIQSSVGFVFVILPVILNQTLNDPDCEQSWYTEDGLLLADPSDPHKLMYPVTSVSSERLVTSHCVNLIHEIICDESRLRLEIMFRVRNETAATLNSDVLDEVTPSLQLSDQLWWILALLFIMVLLLFMCFMLRKRIFRLVQRYRTRLHSSQANVKHNPDPQTPMKFMKLKFNCLAGSEVWLNHLSESLDPLNPAGMLGMNRQGFVMLECVTHTHDVTTDVRTGVTEDEQMKTKDRDGGKNRISTCLPLRAQEKMEQRRTSYE